MDGAGLGGRMGGTSMSKTTWASLNPGEYIAADEFGDRAPTLTITAIDSESFERDTGGHQKRGVVTFKETNRRWVLNETNIQLLGALWPTPEDAIGHRVTLMAESVKFGRETVRGIRVKGSPDIDADVVVAVKLPRKAPQDRTLYSTGRM